MKTSTIIGLASTLFRNRKLRLLGVGLQFGYLSYKFVKSRKQKTLQNTGTDQESRR